ncbi:MAG: hypothetical protein IT385_26505 [Deltaproteobacteria bacterium]|nr:hypothetical protein [Deltaproteobacteria bacterium]
MSPRYVVVFVLAFACDSGPGKRPLGESCEASSECESGLCFDEVCIDPESDDDADGLVNRIEVALGSHPRLADTDADGEADGAEVDALQAAVDLDGDGRPDILESARRDADCDCVPDELDAEDDPIPSGLAACRTEGACATGAEALGVACDVVDETARCDYARVPAWEERETTIDGVDNDCDGATDEADDPRTWYLDRDGDGVGDASSSLQADARPGGHAAEAGDCDDADPDIASLCALMGDGRDGEVTLDQLDLNRAASGQRAAPDGVAWAVVGGASGRALGVEGTSGLAVGDEVLLATLEGTGAGTWEVFSLTAVSESALELDRAPAIPRAAEALTIVQRVPQYASLTVTGTLTAAPWDSLEATPRQTGIVAVKVRGTLRVEGRVDASGLGYRGGCGDGPRGPDGEVVTGGAPGADGAWADGGAGGGEPGGGGGAGAASCSSLGGAGGLGGGGGGGKVEHCSGGTPAKGGGGGGGGAALAAVGNATTADLGVLVHGGGASAGAGGGASGANAEVGAAPATGGAAIGATCAGAGGGIVLLWARRVEVTGLVAADGGAGSAGDPGAGHDGPGSDDGGGGGGSGGQGGAGGAIGIVCARCALGPSSIVARGGAGGAGGSGGSGYGASGGAGGAGGAWGVPATAGLDGVHAGDGGAPGGGGAGGPAGAGGVVLVRYGALGAVTRVGYCGLFAELDAAADAATVSGARLGP